jgi:hypothetical protein
MEKPNPKIGTIKKTGGVNELGNDRSGPLQRLWDVRQKMSPLLYQ